MATAGKEYYLAMSDKEKDDGFRMFMATMEQSRIIEIF